MKNITRRIQRLEDMLGVTLFHRTNRRVELTIVGRNFLPKAQTVLNDLDALLFDELFLHKTGSDPSMPKPRFAVESWFFGASAFAPEYSPIAVA